MENEKQRAEAVDIEKSDVVSSRGRELERKRDEEDQEKSRCN